MPYSRPYASGFQDYPATSTPINSTALNTMDVGIKTANDQFQTVTTAQRTALTPTVGQCVWDSDLRQLMVYLNATGGNAWQPIGNRVVCASTTRPSTPFEGQEIYETDTQKTLAYDGANWIETSDLDSANGLPTAAQAKLDSVGLSLISPTSVAGTGVSLTNGKITLAAASTISINGCFTSTYDNYRIIVTTTAASANALYALRLRVGGADASGASDYSANLLQSASSGTWLNLSYSGAGSSSVIGYKTTTDRTSSAVELYAPALAEKTGFTVAGQYGATPYVGGGSHILATAYDGFSILPSSGDITGSIRIYGYR